MTMAPPAAVVDILSSLLDAMLGSVFRFMGEGSPYLGRATAEIRRPLAEMLVAERRRARELADLIDSLGTVPTPHPVIRDDEQYLAYLSLKFLLPRLVHEKKLQIERYENALSAIGKESREVGVLLAAHLDEMRRELAQLERSANHVIAAAKGADGGAH